MDTRDSIAISPPAPILAYVQLMKPELTLLSVLTAVASAYIAMQGSTHYMFLVHTFIGTTLVGGAAGTLNQYIERRYDALMKRTERRPLPAGHIRPGEALVFGLILALSGILYLSIAAHAIAGVLALLSIVSYLFIYTPLKRRTPFAAILGGIPGALPPLIGWAVVRGGVSLEAWSLFFILFFWQMPHFLALAWMYRNDYARAGYTLFIVMDPSGAISSRQILVYTIALIPASLMPTLVGLAGVTYFTGALILSSGFFAAAIYLYRVRTNAAARHLFFASLFLLPMLFFLMML